MVKPINAHAREKYKAHSVHLVDDIAKIIESRALALEVTKTDLINAMLARSLEWAKKIKKIKHD